MPSRRDPQCRPPWWPENEPWRPPGRGDQRHPPRARFFRRLALIAAGLLVAAVMGATVLAWVVATWFGIDRGHPVVFAPFAVVAALLIVAAVRGFGRPFRRFSSALVTVMEAADRVADGDYSTRVQEHGPSPIRALARSFNTMTERLERNEGMRRNLMADIAHELRTPLAIMQGKLEGLLDGVYSPDEQHLQELLDEAHVLSRLVEDLRTLALSESGSLKLQREPTDLAVLAREMKRAFEAGASARGVTVLVDAPDHLEQIDVDPVRIREVIGNLLSNAVSHTPTGGSVTLRIANRDTAGALIEVHDTGVGMTGEQLAHAFDRFSKGTGSRGSGLGLTIAKGLIEAHGGQIHASSEPGRGTTMTITIPRPEEPVSIPTVSETLL
jgi:signal transduction histidine kinase